jgi:hypothetical protein
MSGLKQVARSGLGGLASGVFLYFVADTLNDFYIYKQLHSKAIHLAEKDDGLLDLVGTPFKSGAWYNATLGFSHRDHVAHCSFQLTGSKRTTDIVVQAGRQTGTYRSTLLYNVLGPASWDLLSCQAMFPGAGGLAEPRSLMPEHKDQQEGSAAAAAAAATPADCKLCQPQTQQQQQQPAATKK